MTVPAVLGSLALCCAVTFGILAVAETLTWVADQIPRIRR
jgi:hypothetical protein